jgi:tetratricopeptide (TPR) repeat protein
VAYRKLPSDTFVCGAAPCAAINSDEKPVHGGALFSPDRRLQPPLNSASAKDLPRTLLTRLALALFFIAPTYAQTCATCHPAEWQSYRKTGMAQSFSRPKPETTQTYYHQASDTFYQNLQRDGHYFQRQYQLGFDGQQTNVRDTEIDYVLGSGNHARSYLHRTAQNTLILLPLGWYAEKGGTWAMNPGYDRPDHQALRRDITYDCMFCHNAYPEIPSENRGPRAAPVFSKVPEGIDCQRCHGNSDRHAALARTGSTPAVVRAAIVNPSLLPIDRQMEVCMQCHLQTTSSPLPASIVRYERAPFSYQPGEPLSDFMLHFDHSPGTGFDAKFEITGSAYRLRKSKCFQKAVLKCTTCHDPHNEAARNFTQVCRQCHAPALDRFVAAGRHTASSDCVGCHMPKRRTDDVVHAVMTDHYIQRTPPVADLPAAKSEQPQPEYRGEVVLYYPPALPKPEDELYLAIAQVSQSSNLDPGITRLSSAIAKFRPAQAEYYVQLGDALSNAGETEQALPVYEQALLHQPQSEPALLRLAICLTALRQYARAETVLTQALKLAPTDAAALVQLGLVQLGQGKTPVTAWETAKQSDPDMVEPYNLLGAILFEGGDATRAESTLRDAIRVQPNFAPAHNNLGNLLSETDRFEEAKFHFEAALRYKDNYLGARYNYALALNRARRIDEAQTQVEAILRANPNSAEAHEFLGNLLTAKGQPGPAILHYREAIRINPAFDRANLDLGSALANNGNPVAALPYLRQAAQSRDAETREAAQKLLEKFTQPRP